MRNIVYAPLIVIMISSTFMVLGCEKGKRSKRPLPNKFQKPSVSEKIQDRPTLSYADDDYEGDKLLEGEDDFIDRIPNNDSDIPQRRPLAPQNSAALMPSPIMPPPIDPLTGGPYIPPPPPVPPGIVEDDFLPVVPFFVTPICGNKILTAGKQCEDGNVENGDGCSSACKKEYCGNGLVELGEQCDNGAGRYTVQGPGCDQYCQFIICGDFYVTGDEECDDGNREDCDGCSRDCKVEKIGATCSTTDCPCLGCDKDSDDESCEES